MTMIERMQELERRVGAVENERARNITALVERLDALEQRLPPTIEAVAPLAFPLKDPSLASMQIGPGAVAPQNLAMPDYLLAPAPDYSSERPAEVEPCSCEEAEQLRAECARLRSAVPFTDDPDRVATLARKLASETESYQRALKAEYAKRESVESELSAALQAIDLLRSLDNVQRAVAYLDRAEKAESRVAEQRERIRQDCIAAAERAADVDELRSELAELNAELARMQRMRNDAIAECEQLKHERQRLLGESDSRLNRIGELVADLAAADALLRIHATQPLHPNVRAHLSAQPASPEVIDVSAAYEGNPDITMPASECQPPPPTYHDRAVLDAMGRDMDRCRAGLKPEHAIDSRLDHYAERLAERVVCGISGKTEDP